MDRVLAEKAKIEALVNAMPDGVALANLRGEPEYINRLALSILQLTPSEIRGLARPLHELLSPKEFSGAFHRALKTHSESKLIELHEGKRTRYYSPKVVLCAKGAPAGPDGRKAKEEVGTLLILQDVTLEEELSRMKEEFFDSIVHDLRTPLSAIKGFIELMVDRGMVDDRAKPFIPTIRNSCSKLQSLIQDILDAAKMESGQMELKYRTVHTQEALDSMRTLFQMQAQERGVELRLESPQPPIEFEADRELLERVLMNLIGNAMKFTPAKGSITVTGRSVRLAAGGPGVEFAVQDTGTGIPEEKLEVIFEKFKQLDAGTAQRVGYGLGLNICKKVVELHGGRIWAESKVAQGTRFVLQFPSKRASERLPR